MNNVLVTGASGYIGARLCVLLSQNKYSVSGLCYPDIPSNTEWVSLLNEVILGDISKEETIEEIAKRDFDIIIHLVSLDHHQSESNPSFVSSVNVLPTWNLLNAFSNKGSLKKFIYFSTFQVYGEVPLIEITEEFKPSPQNTYGLTHLLSENICSHFNNKTDVNCINIRLSNSYGSPVFEENNCWWLVINDLCKTAFYEKKIKLQSDGSPQRDFIHSIDVFNALDILIKTTEKNKINNTYHISSGKTLTILELAHFVKSVYQKKYGNDILIIMPDESISENFDDIFKPNKYTISNSKLKSLGFTQTIDLETGINETFNYLEKHYEKEIKIPLVSVIVTTYNRKELLKETIDSILSQTFTDFELIVVDNYSNYDFIEYIKSFNDLRIRPFQNQNNGIIAINRNIGINNARGEYIAFCDDDDLWKPNKLKIQYSFLIENNNYIGVGCQSDFFGAKKGIRNDIESNLEIDFGIAISKKTAPLSSLLVRKIDVLFDEDRGLVFVEDKDYQIQIILETKKKILLLKEKLIKYRLHAEANSNLSSRKLNNINIYKKHKNSLNESLYNRLIAKAYMQGATVELRDMKKPGSARKYCYQVLGLNSLRWKFGAIIMIFVSFFPTLFIDVFYDNYYLFKRQF